MAGFGDQSGGPAPSGAGSGSVSPARLREALSLLRDACTSQSSRQALRTVEADVLQGDTSQDSRGQSGANRDTPGSRSRGGNAKGGIPPQFLRNR